MNIASDPKSLPQNSLLSPEANQAAALATATGVLTVDLDAIVANWRKLEKTAVPAECAGVVKANAYGCGAEQVARALSNGGCKTFFVATLDEARVVRGAVPASAAVYVLDGFFQNSGEAYAQIDCRPVIGDLNELAEWDVFCRRSGWSGGAAIHIDTGMNRLGLTISEAQGIIPRINAGDHGITLVMSHLVSAEQRKVSDIARSSSFTSGQPDRSGGGILFVKHFEQIALAGLQVARGECHAWVEGKRRSRGRKDLGQIGHRVIGADGENRFIIGVKIEFVRSAFDWDEIGAEAGAKIRDLQIIADRHIADEIEGVRAVWKIWGALQIGDGSAGHVVIEFAGDPAAGNFPCGEIDF